MSLYLVPSTLLEGEREGEKEEEREGGKEGSSA